MAASKALWHDVVTVIWFHARQASKACTIEGELSLPNSSWTSLLLSKSALWVGHHLAARFRLSLLDLQYEVALWRGGPSVLTRIRCAALKTVQLVSYCTVYDVFSALIGVRHGVNREFR